MKYICFKTKPAKRDYTLLPIPVEFMLYDWFERTKRCKEEKTDHKT